MSVDAPDTDLWVKLLDVAPDGTAFNLMSTGLDVVRASYRNRQRERELLEPGEVYRLDLDTLMTANRFRRGHRVRVAVMAQLRAEHVVEPAHRAPRDRARPRPVSRG